MNDADTLPIPPISKPANLPVSAVSQDDTRGHTSLAAGDGRSKLEKRKRFLCGNYIAALGGQLTEARRLDVERAAEMVVMAEQARATYAAHGSVKALVAANIAQRSAEKALRALRVPPSPRLPRGLRVVSKAEDGAPGFLSRMHSHATPPAPQGAPEPEAVAEQPPDETAASNHDKPAHACK
jgi:hypothetical protein